MSKRLGQAQRSGWSRRQLQRLLRSEGDALDILVVHEAALEMNIPSPIVDYCQAEVPHLIPRLVIIKKSVARAEPKHKPPKKVTSRSGYVYAFKSDDGKYKLGRARNVERRLQNLKVGSSVDITLVCKVESSDYVVLENLCHKKFASKRLHGEWFALDASDIEWLQNLPENI